MSHRRTLRTRTAIGLALAAALIVPAGCGVVYQSPTVSRAAGAGMDVRTIDLTPETVLLANRSPYSPRSLPREFYSAASARQGAGLGALPDAPDTPEQGNPVPSDGRYANKSSWPDVEKDHAASVTYLDQRVGHVLAALDAHGLAASTAVAQRMQWQFNCMQ